MSQFYDPVKINCGFAGPFPEQRDYLACFQAGNKGVVYYELDSIYGVIPTLFDRFKKYMM